MENFDLYCQIYLQQIIVFYFSSAIYGSKSFPTYTNYLYY
jgi:hypothetical protein